MGSPRKVHRARETMKKPKKRQSKASLQRILTYRSWNMMLERCNNPKHVGYTEYGGRSIHVFDRWQPTRDTDPNPGNGPSRAVAFSNFIRDVGLRPSKKHTLDRIDANGHYVPGNVRWATAFEQGSNKRTTHYIRHPTTGAKVAAAHVARELGVTYQQLRARLMKEGKWFGLTFDNQPDDVIRELKP